MQKAPEPLSRDLRLDFLRGVALLVVLVDHIEDQTYSKVLRPWAPVSTCFFDGAEAFVFLSGLVFGRAFRRRYEEYGFIAQGNRILFSGKPDKDSFQDFG